MVSYHLIAAQMVLMGTGLGLTSTAATESIMGVVKPEQAGAGSAVNDATREIGGALGVAVLGSVYSSLYASHLRGQIGGLPSALVQKATSSFGAGRGVAARIPGVPGIVFGQSVARVVHERVTRGLLRGRRRLRGRGGLRRRSPAEPSRLDRGRRLGAVSIVSRRARRLPRDGLSSTNEVTMAPAGVWPERWAYMGGP